MPTYDYPCESHDAKVSPAETMTKHASNTLACPKRKSKQVRRIFVSFYAKTVRKS